MQENTVIVADDHQLLRQGLSVLLKQHGFGVVGQARTGKEAVTLTRQFRPDIVVMDLAMPELSGFEAMRQVLEDYPQTKIIAVSALTDAVVVREALAAGALAFVPKEAAFEELSVALAAVKRGETYVSPMVAGALVHSYQTQSKTSLLSGMARPLTSREREVLQLVAEGFAMKQIAVKLHISVKTVETHRRQIMDKLDLHSVAELTKYAVRHGITPN